MKLSLSRSGGFAGIHEVLEIDTDELSKLAERASKAAPTACSGSDFYTYSLTVDGRTVEFQAPKEDDLPAEVKALVSYFWWKSGRAKSVLATSRLSEFLLAVSSEPKKLEAFQKEPEQAMDLAGLSASEKAVIRSQDENAIRYVMADIAYSAAIGILITGVFPQTVSNTGSFLANNVAVGKFPTHKFIPRK